MGPIFLLGKLKSKDTLTKWLNNAFPSTWNGEIRKLMGFEVFEVREGGRGTFENFWRMAIFACEVVSHEQKDDSHWDWCPAYI